MVFNGADHRCRTPSKVRLRTKAGPHPRVLRGWRDDGLFGRIVCGTLLCGGVGLGCVVLRARKLTWREECRGLTRLPSFSGREREEIHVFPVSLIKKTCPCRTAVPDWGRTTWTLTCLSPKRDCGSKGVKNWYQVPGINYLFSELVERRICIFFLFCFFWGG